LSAFTLWNIAGSISQRAEPATHGIGLGTNCIISGNLWSSRQQVPAPLEEV